VTVHLQCERRVAAAGSPAPLDGISDPVRLEDGVPGAEGHVGVAAFPAGVLNQVVRNGVPGDTGAFRGRDRLQRTDSALELGGGPSQGSVTPALDTKSALRAGQVTYRSFLEEHGGQRAGVAESGGVHRRCNDRLPVGIAAGPGITKQQVRDPGQVLGHLPLLPGARGRRHRSGQHRVAGAGRGGHLCGGEPVRDVDDPAPGRIDPRRVTTGQLGQPLEQPPNDPGRVSRPGPRARRGNKSGPLLGPHTGDYEMAFTLEQVGQAAQHGRAAVGVGILAQLAQPQHGAGRDPGIQPLLERGDVQRVVQLPVRKPPGHHFVDVEALAYAVTSPGARVQALADVARVVAEAGDLDRAEALARATTDPGTRARALTEVAHVAAQAGDPGRVTRLAADAEALASAITNKYARARALTDVARLAAQVGDLDRAEALARPLTPPNYQALALTEVARIAAEAGDLDRAVSLAQAITSPYDCAQALTAVARVAAQAGDSDGALRLAADAEAQARTITDPGARTRPLTDVARVAAQAGDSDGALRLAADAETQARTITYPGAQAIALTEVARVAAEAGDLDRAVRLAQAITSPGTRAQLLTQVARMAFQSGDPDRAKHLLVPRPGTLFV